MCFVVWVYGVDIDSLLDFVVEFVDLGGYLYLFVCIYLFGMKLWLVFVVLIGILFDIYLVDEVISVGDVYF